MPGGDDYYILVHYRHIILALSDPEFSLYMEREE